MKLSPFREAGYGLLMEALAAQGNTAEALQVYDALRCRLRDELGTAPSAELQALHQRLLGPTLWRRSRTGAGERELTKVEERSSDEPPPSRRQREETSWP